VIAEGNYGQTEGVFLCLLSFARAKKVRRLPAATGITAMVYGLSQVLSTHHNIPKAGDVPWDAGTVPITVVHRPNGVANTENEVAVGQARRFSLLKEKKSNRLTILIIQITTTHGNPLPLYNHIVVRFLLL
jgi:hypothetical protein